MCVADRVVREFETESGKSGSKMGFPRTFLSEENLTSRKLPGLSRRKKKRKLGGPEPGKVCLRTFTILSELLVLLPCALKT